MIIGFESYTPQAWSDANGLMLSDKAQRASAHPQKGGVRRSGNWSVIVSRAFSGACLAISSLLLPTSSGAVTIPTLTVDVQDFDVAKPKSSQTIAISPIREINQSFNRLFDSVRAGQSLIPSEDVRLLAQKALQSQMESVDIDSWARKLANDIKDAKD